MSLSLNNTEKLAIKMLMVYQMHELAALIKDQAECLNNDQPIDEDTDFLIMEMKKHKNLIYMCQYLYDPLSSYMTSYNLEKFRKSDEYIRDYVLDVIKNGLDDKKLISKIIKHLKH
jgi:hypothetical protein